MGFLEQSPLGAVRGRQIEKLTTREKMIWDAFSVVIFDAVSELLNENFISKESYKKVELAVADKRKEEPIFRPSQAWLRKCAEGLITKEINNFSKKEFFQFADPAYEEMLGKLSSQELKDLQKEEKKYSEKSKELLKNSLIEFYKTHIAKESALPERKRA